MSSPLVSAGTPQIETSNFTGLITPSYGQATTAGNVAVAWLQCNSGSATDPFSLDSGTGWEQAAVGGAAFGWSGIWCKRGLGAGEAPPQFAIASGDATGGMLAEFDGSMISGILDQPGDGGSAGATETAACAAPDAGPGELIVFAANYNGGGSATTIDVTMSDSSGAPVTPVVYDNPGDTTGWKYVFAWGQAGEAGAVADTATSVLGVFSEGGCCIASIRATDQGAGAFSAAGALSAAARATANAAAALAATGSLAGQAVVARRAQGGLAAAPGLSVSARVVKAAQATLSAAPSLGVHGSVLAAGLASLAATGALAVRATAGPDLEALWEAYQVAAAVAAAKRQQWRMMRQAGGTDGTAGFLYGQAYEAEHQEETAYQAFLAAQREVHPGVTG